MVDSRLKTSNAYSLPLPKKNYDTYALFENDGSIHKNSTWLKKVTPGLYVLLSRLFQSRTHLIWLFFAISATIEQNVSTRELNPPHAEKLAYRQYDVLVTSSKNIRLSAKASDIRL